MTETQDRNAKKIPARDHGGSFTVYPAVSPLLTPLIALHPVYRPLPAPFVVSLARASLTPLPAERSGGRRTTGERGAGRSGRG